MAFAEHTLVTFGGQLGYGGATNTVDRWQCGVRVANWINGAPVGQVTAPDQYIALVGPALKTVLTTVTGGYASMASDQSLDFVKVAQIGADGKYAAVAGNPWLWTTGLPVAGGMGRVGPPMQAIRLTWTTANTRGRGHIGGIFVPFVGYAGWNTSTISAAAQTAYRDWGKAILVALHQTTAADNQEKRPVIASRLAGTLTPITGVKVGSVIDVQRRRKEQVVETYSAVSVFP